MELGDNIEIFGDWAKLHYTENPGMAFGFIFGGKTGKLVLSIFRIIAIAGLIWYLLIISKQKLHKIAVISVALVLTGALGNLIDSAFYGLIFDSGTAWSDEAQDWVGYGGVSEMNFGGYAGFLGGSVVDMLHFPMFDGTYPEWFPKIGGNKFTFFGPVFNIADSFIFIGVVLIIIFRKRFIIPEELPQEFPQV